MDGDGWGVGGEELGKETRNLFGRLMERTIAALADNPAGSRIALSPYPSPLSSSQLKVMFNISSDEDQPVPPARKKGKSVATTPRRQSYAAVTTPGLVSYGASTPKGAACRRL